MAIIIENISEQHNVEYGKGEQHYRLRINNHIKCEFTHNFSDGLATCLRKAAEAFENKEQKDIEQLLNLFKWHLYD